MFFEVIVSDKYLILVNAINIVFPKPSNLLCRFHINKNFKAKCKMLVDSMEACKVIMDAWGTVIDCIDCDAFEGCVKHFESIYLSCYVD